VEYLKIIFVGKLEYLLYLELANTFADFEFTKNVYISEGKVKRQHSGINKFAIVKIKMQINTNTLMSNTFLWGVSEEEIPIEFLDCILKISKLVNKNKPYFV
jgi:hypothetical protein